MKHLLYLILIAVSCVGHTQDTSSHPIRKIHLDVLVVLPEKNPCLENQEIYLFLYESDSSLIFKRKLDSTGRVYIHEKDDGTSYLVHDREYFIEVKGPGIYNSSDRIYTYRPTSKLRIIREIYITDKTPSPDFPILYFPDTVLTLSPLHKEKLNSLVNTLTLHCNMIVQMNYYCHDFSNECHMKMCKLVFNYLVESGIKSERILLTAKNVPEGSSIPVDDWIEWSILSYDYLPSD